MDPAVHHSLGQISTALHAINHMPANKYIHKDRHGDFIATAFKHAWIPGAQTAAKIWKGQTNEKLAEDIHLMARDAIIAINDNLAALRAGGG